MAATSVAEVTLSSKHQIVVPREARRALGLRPGDRLVIVTLGESVVLMKRPGSYTGSAKGAGRGLYPARYLEAERGPGADDRRYDWRAARRIALDTTPVLYHLEDHPTLAPLVLPVFRSIERGEREATASSLAFLELLIGPYRAGDDARRDHLTALLVAFPNLTWVGLDLAVADRAADLRTRYDLRSSDAIHLASALVAGADLFLTGDRRLRRVTEIAVALVAELEPESARRR